MLKILYKIGSWSGKVAVKQESALSCAKRKVGDWLHPLNPNTHTQATAKNDQVLARPFDRSKFRSRDRAEPVSGNQH